MSILSNKMNISENGRRRCGQRIESSEFDEIINPVVCSTNVDYLINGSIEWTVNFNDVCPEVFQIIITYFILFNKWTKLIPLRLVSKYWRLNIDTYLSTRKVINYSGPTYTQNDIPKPINYFEFYALTSCFSNMKQLIINNFFARDDLLYFLRKTVPNLERLNLSGCVRFSARGINYLTIKYPQLISIDVSNCQLDENW